MGEDEKNMRLSEQAAADFAKTSGEGREAQRKELQEVAAKFTSPVALYEGGTFLASIAFCVALLFVAWGIWGNNGDFKSRLPILALGIFMGGFPFWILTRRKKPAMTLTPTGVLLSGAQDELPWRDVEQIELHTVSVLIRSQTQVFFYLYDGAKPPAFSGDRRIRYKDKKNVVQILVVDYKGVNDKKLNELLSNAHNAGAARAMLEEM